MKAVLEGIEFEGTPEEFSQLLKEYRQNNKTDKPQVTSHIVHENKSEKNNNSREWYMHLDFLPNAREFVESLYYYKPEHGGSSLALLILTTGKQYTLRSVANKAKCDSGSMSEVIQRSIDAGCQIDIDNSKVSPGALSRARKVKYIKDGQENFIAVTGDTKVRYVALGTVEKAKQVASQSRKSLFVKKSKKTQYVSTGSPPVTKIIHR
jgi:hypothetical protein